MNLPPSSPTKVAHSIPVSRSNPWQTTVSQSATQSPPESSDQALQDRRRTRTRTRTRSTDISMDSNTTFETSLPSPPPFPSTRKLPPLSIQIPHSPSQQTQPSRTRSISGSTFATKQHNPSTDHSSFTPRSRQPSASHAPTHSQSLRTPRSSHFPHFQPPMSERPRNTSSSHHQHFASPIKVRDSHRERERTSTTTASTSNLATPATYESFDFPLPAETTPSEEREARLCLEKKRRMCCGLGRLFIRGSSSNGENDWRKDVGERTRLLGENIEREVQGKEIGKWEYVWGEVVCYAKVRNEFSQVLQSPLKWIADLTDSF